VRILIADDDPTTLRLVSHAVEALGHEPTTASDGADAREKFLADWFPVIITDWEMPGLSGIELCRQVRAASLPVYTYILILTKRTEKQHLIEALAAGADDFISKPFSPHELQARLGSAERIVSLEADLRQANGNLTPGQPAVAEDVTARPADGDCHPLDFEERISTLHQRAVDSASDYGLVMRDVDHFKLHNDKYGHQNGDQVLRDIAEAIRKSLRASDAVFRYGGEEVLLFLSGQNLEGAAATAERVRRSVEEQEFRSGEPKEKMSVTISCGVASYPVNARPDRDWRGIVEQADRALYEAKARGRNRVVAAQADLPGKVKFSGETALDENSDTHGPHPDSSPDLVPSETA
jgi:diguanylate cyclase (GGDEF)-like protein